MGGELEEFEMASEFGITAAQISNTVNVAQEVKDLLAENNKAVRERLDSMYPSHTSDDIDSLEMIRRSEYDVELDRFIATLLYRQYLNQQRLTELFHKSKDESSNVS